MDKIIRELTIEITSESALKKFIKELSEWWPKEYTWAQDTLKDIWIDGRQDGLCTEIGPYGFRCDWGLVVELVENKKIGLKWQISPKREPVPNPEKASDITISFKSNDNSSTTLEFEHFNFENHGEGSEDYRKMMNSAQGWDYILDSFKEYCEK
jgi:hypothetical protein